MSTRTTCPKLSGKALSFLLILFGICLTSTTTLADEICVPKADLEFAAKEFDQLKLTLDTCIQEADKIKTQRDHCTGKLDSSEIRLRALELEKAELSTKVDLLRADADSKWSWYVWFAIGAIVPPTAYFTFTLISD